jgi:hypothetical protein
MQRTLPKASTDFGLLDELIRVHESVSTLADRSLYDWWQRWNKAYFNNTLRPLFIYFGNSDYGRHLGFHRVLPRREIMIQKSGISCDIKGLHHIESAKRHDAFSDVPDSQYALALILLHEMMHQAVYEAGGDLNDNCHLTPIWLELCNFIGDDLGLGLTYAPMVRAKQAQRNDDGNAIKSHEGKTVRQNVWRPKKAELRANTERFATYDECRKFPFRGDEKLDRNIVF